MKIFFVIIGTMIKICAMAQVTLRKLSVTGYGEIYYSYDFNKPSGNSKPPFLFNHNRHNEFNLNLGFVKATYNNSKARANIALATGTYIIANYSVEPEVLKHVYEANIGIKLSKKINLWADAGILPSHIGFESAVSKDCWALTRSILAENSPYYEAGVKLSYLSPNDTWLVSILALNGWQRITRLNSNSLMSWGSQVQFKPSGKFLINYSNFIGTDKPDSVRLIRSYHNLYGIFTLGNNLGLILGFDLGIEEKTPVDKENICWFSPVGILQYSISKNLSISGRLEYYNDKNEVLISNHFSKGFITTGYSINLDYKPLKDILLRIEGRRFQAREKIFNRTGIQTNNNTAITSSIAISF